MCASFDFCPNSAKPQLTITCLEISHVLAKRKIFNDRDISCQRISGSIIFMLNQPFFEEFIDPTFTWCFQEFWNMLGTDALCSVNFGFCPKQQQKKLVKKHALKIPVFCQKKKFSGTQKIHLQLELRRTKRKKILFF